MGYYIQTPQHTGKVQYLCEHHGAKLVEPVQPSALAPDRAIVCVVLNVFPTGAFEAAAYCFDDDEFAAFARPDPRPRRWLVMDKATVERLSGYPRA